MNSHFDERINLLTRTILCILLYFKLMQVSIVNQNCSVKTLAYFKGGVSGLHKWIAETFFLQMSVISTQTQLICPALHEFEFYSLTVKLDSHLMKTFIYFHLVETFYLYKIENRVKSIEIALLLRFSQSRDKSVNCQQWTREFWFNQTIQFKTVFKIKRVLRRTARRSSLFFEINHVLSEQFLKRKSDKSLKSGYFDCMGYFDYSWAYCRQVWGTWSFLHNHY